MERVSYHFHNSPDEADEAVCIWKIQDSLFEGWGEDGWVAEDLSPDGKLNAGGR
jgi:coronin-1B/1C/6